MYHDRHNCVKKIKTCLFEAYNKKNNVMRQSSCLLRAIVFSEKSK